MLASSPSALRASEPPPAGGFGYGTDAGPLPAFGPVIPPSPHAPSGSYAGWTLVVGILSIVGIALCMLSIPLGIGVIAMGVHALRKIDRHPDLYTGRGFAVAGIVCGVISLVGTAACFVLLYCTSK